MEMEMDHHDMIHLPISSPLPPTPTLPSSPDFGVEHQMQAYQEHKGLAYNATENVLYVADTVNHALRLIDFVNEDVQTMAGNATKGSGGRKGTNQPAS